MQESYLSLEAAARVLDLPRSVMYGLKDDYLSSSSDVQLDDHIDDDINDYEIQ
jgi:hypothetical protein